MCIFKSLKRGAKGCKEEREIKLPFPDKRAIKNVLHVDLCTDFTKHGE